MENNFLSDKSFAIPHYLGPSAWVEHIPFAFWLIEKQKPKLLVELGVFYGVSYFSFCQAVKENNLNTLCYGVDNWVGDDHAGFYDEKVFDKVNGYNAGNYSDFSYLIKSEFDNAVSGFQDGSIDLLHIDGLHLYESVKKDFETWSPKLSDSSIVLFHDIAVRDRDFGVYRLWEELSAKYPSFSFTHGYGLGVLATGKKIPAGLSALFKIKEADSRPVKSHYYRLGQGLLDKLNIVEYKEKIEKLNDALREEENAKRLLEEKLNLEISNFNEQLANFRQSGAQSHDLQKKIEGLEEEIISYHQKEITYQQKENTREDEITELKKNVSAQQSDLATSQKEIRQLKEQLAANFLEFSARETEIRNENLVLEGKITKLIREYSSQLEEASVKINYLESRIAEKDNEIAVLNNTFKNLETDTRKKDEELKNAERKKSFFEEDFVKLNQDILTQGQHIKNLEFQLAKERHDKDRYYRDLVELTSSSSWKLTKPLRVSKKSMTSLPAKLRKTTKKILIKFGIGNYSIIPGVPPEYTNDYQLLESNSLFSSEWYLTQYPDVLESKVNPLVHYLQHGYKERRDPSKHFSTARYFDDYPDIQAGNINPLVHYIRHGKSEGRKYEASSEKRTVVKKPVKQTETVVNKNSQGLKIVEKKVLKPVSSYTYKRGCREYNVIAESGLFNDVWYLSEYPEVLENNIDPIEHYLNAGYQEGYNPNPLFHTQWYLDTYEDVRRNKDNPFIHYIARGGEEHREPHPLFRLNYYFQYNPDLASAGVNPLEHFIKTGYKELRKIHPLFDETFYQKQTGLDPQKENLFLHYLSKGWKQNFNPNPFFDVDYYISTNLSGHRQEPLTHFVQESEEQSLNPSPYFDTNFYLYTNNLPGSLASDLLIHFLTMGIDQLRRPSFLFRILDFKQKGGLKTIRQTIDLEQFLNTGPMDPVYEYLETKARIEANEKSRLESFRPERAKIYDLKDDEVPGAAKTIKFLKKEQPVVSVIIPCYNSRKYVIECLLSVSKWAKDAPIEVMVINDCSTDDVIALAEKIPNLVFVSNEKNAGFIKTCNRGAELAKGKYLLFLNSDAQITENSIENLIKAMDNDPLIGVAGPKVLYPSGHLQEAGCKLYPDGSSGLIGLNDNPNLPRYNYSREVDYVSGCCLMIRSDVFEKIGGFSSLYEPCYCEDSDLCMKTRAEGYKIMYVHDSEMYHHLTAVNSNAHKNYHVAMNQGKFFKRWFTEIQKLNEIKIIPFYFPQFHLYKENEFWWGKGFTEWTNVTKAMPNYVGHIQPKLPSDQGFYDISLPEAMEHQKRLAEKYEVDGFCYYYYWFAGKRIMELPLERIVNENKPDMPFCICWANENFTRRWDGGNNEIMLGQDHTDEDDEAVIRDMLRYAKHKNYIRIDGKPLIFLYRFSLFPDIKRTVQTWRRIARETGVGEIYLGFVESFQHAYQMDDPKDYGFDVSVQFPPHQNSAIIPPPGELLNPDFTGNIHDYREMVLKYTGKQVPAFRRFPGTMPGWDNTPRQKNKPNIFAATSPGSFQAWLEWNIKISGEQNPPSERFVFVNAWNEWAEGTFLEPSREDGHGFLEAVRNAKQSWLR